MAKNQVDIIIRAVAKGTKGVFSGLTSDIKRSRLALDAFRTSVKKTNQATGQLAGELKGLAAGVGVGVITQQLWEAGTQAQRLNLAFEAIAGSSGGAKSELQYIREESDRLGLVFYSTAEAYKQIFAAGTAGNVDLDTTRKIFSGFSESFAALGLNADQVEGSLRAVGQMMGKNKVLAEELRTQLGEKLSVAIQYFAQAAGASVEEFEKMMANGEVGVDTIARTAELLSEKYGPKAEEASRMAVGALAKWKTAWWDLKVTLSEAGFLENATNYLTELTRTLRDPAVQVAIKEWAKRFFEVADAIIRTAWEWKGFIAAFIGTALVVKTISGITSVVMGMYRAFKILKGLNLIAWFMKLRTVVVAAASGMGASFALMFGIAGMVAYDIIAIKNLISQYMEYKKIMKEVAEIKAENERASAKLAGRYREISEATGVTVNSMEELDKAVEEGRIHFNETAKAWKAGAGKMTDAVKQAADKQKSLTKKQLSDMEAAWKKYTDNVKKLQDSLKDHDKSTAERLREIARSGMSDTAAWKDRKKEAQEYEEAAQKAYEAARKALEGGDEKEANKLFEEAKGLADDATEAYADLQGQVMKGEKVWLSEADAAKVAYDNVEAVAELKKEILKAELAYNQAQADKTNEESGFKFESAKEGIEELDAAWDKHGSITIPSIGKAYTLMFDETKKSANATIAEIDLKTGELIEKTRAMPIEIDIEDPKEKLDDLGAKTETYAKIIVPEIGKEYSLVWDSAEKEGRAMIKEVDSETKKFLDKKRTMEIDVKLNKPSQSELNKLFGDMPGVSASTKQLGGLIGVTKMATGGLFAAVRNAAAGFHFNGYGGGDRPKNLVMAEDGEVMIRKESVRASGLKAALAWNEGRFDVVLEELIKRFAPGLVLKKQLGGLIKSIPRPEPILGMSGGGIVASPVAAGSTYNLTTHFAGDVAPISRQTARSNARMILDEIKRMDRSSS